MPKIHRAPAAGCQVTGVFYRADGRPLAGQRVRFLPTRGGIWQGRVIGRASVEVITDAQGRLAVELAPSSVVGRYEVTVDEARYAVDVPDRPAALFEEIALAG